MTEPFRLIKKYPNRRLYDTRSSCYITLAQVKELVRKQESFKVVDAKTAEDLTRTILLQIIMEEEAGGTPLFTHEVLTLFIRSYGNPLAAAMRRSLDGLLPSDELRDAQPVPSVIAADLIDVHMNRNKALFSRLQQDLLSVDAAVPKAANAETP